MLKKIQALGILICTASLSACLSHNPNGYMNFQSYTYDNQLIYPENYGGYGNYGNYSDQVPLKKQIVVPETYHVGSYHSPTSHKNRDRNWVARQNPRSYTIELADDEKASKVAKKLYKAPTSDRRAQIRYERSGKSYYKGLYGSYPSYEAAQKALNKLPSHIKESANIKTWGSVQSDTSKSLIAPQSPHAF